MKIFNWMHRRFHRSAFKDGLARNVKKAETITNEADKQSLLKQVALVDVLDGWKDGILTIGTLGLDPLRPFNQHNEYFVLESEEEDEIDSNVDEEDVQVQEPFDSDDEDDDYSSFIEREEENPLMFTRFDHNFENIGSTFDDKSDVIMTVDPTENELQRKRKGERITLAELFLADSEMKKKTDSVEIEPKLAKKTSLRAKNGLSFAKKFIPNVGDDSRLIKKIHQLMRRMLKRKIHPELEGKSYIAENQSQNGIVEVGIVGKGNELIAESVYLLPTHPAPGPTKWSSGRRSNLLQVNVSEYCY